MIRIFRWSIYAAVVVLLQSCSAQHADAPRGTSSSARSAGANVTSGCVDRFAEGIDYFPHKAVIEDARNFSVEYHNFYKIVTVRHAYSGGPAERYVLVQCGAPKPALGMGLESAPLVTVAVTSIFSASPTHLQALADIGRIDAVTGIASATHVTVPRLLSRISSGSTIEFAPASVIDTERVVASAPSIFMTAGVFDASLSAVRAAGIPVVANVDWLEETALARSEWAKYSSLFLNEEQNAQTAFDGVKRAYVSLSDRTAGIPDQERPSVMTGRPREGPTSARAVSPMSLRSSRMPAEGTSGATTLQPAPSPSIWKRNCVGPPMRTSGSTAGAGPTAQRCSPTNPDIRC